MYVCAHSSKLFCKLNITHLLSISTYLIKLIQCNCAMHLTLHSHGIVPTDKSLQRNVMHSIMLSLTLIRFHLFWFSMILLIQFNHASLLIAGLFFYFHPLGFFDLRSLPILRHQGFAVGFKHHAGKHSCCNEALVPV